MSKYDCFLRYYSIGVSWAIVRTSSSGCAGSSLELPLTKEKELEWKENGWSCKNLGGQCKQFTRQMPNIKIITTVTGSSWVVTFSLFWSKATVTLTHSESKTKTGLVLYTNVDFSDSDPEISGKRRYWRPHQPQFLRALFVELNIKIDPISKMCLLVGLGLGSWRGLEFGCVKPSILYCSVIW